MVPERPARAADSGADVAAVVAAFGATLHPLVAGRRGGRLARYFRIEVPDDRASALRDRLAAMEGVESASFLPEAGLPEG